MIKLDKPAECPACGYPFGTVIPDECPGCNAEIIGCDFIDGRRLKLDRMIDKRAGELLRMTWEISGERGLVAIRREPAEEHNRLTADKLKACVDAMPVSRPFAAMAAATSTRSIVVDDAKREAIATFQREQDRKLDKPVCVKCGRAVDLWSFDYATGTCSSCIEKAKT